MDPTRDALVLRLRRLRREFERAGLHREWRAETRGYGPGSFAEIVEEDPLDKDSSPCSAAESPQGSDGEGEGGGGHGGSGDGLPDPGADPSQDSAKNPGGPRDSSGPGRRVEAPPRELWGRLAAQLRGGTADNGEAIAARLQRAWEAGLGARAKLAGHAARTGATAKAVNHLRNRYYVVLRTGGGPGGPGGPGGRANGEAFHTNRWAVVLAQLGTPFPERSVFHGFPSLAEAAMYCCGAGVAKLPEFKP